jgi:hypothetical protein
MRYSTLPPKQQEQGSKIFESPFYSGQKTFSFSNIGVIKKWLERDTQE